MDEKQIKTMRMSVENAPIDIEPYEERDEYGIYQTGVFASGKNATVLVTHSPNWHLAIHAKTPLGLVQLRAFKNTFIPNDVTMALFFESRKMEGLKKENIYHLYEVFNEGTRTTDS